jgi:hypothetical protein
MRNHTLRHQIGEKAQNLHPRGKGIGQQPIDAAQKRNCIIMWNHKEKLTIQSVVSLIG